MKYAGFQVGYIAWGKNYYTLYLILKISHLFCENLLEEVQACLTQACLTQNTRLKQLAIHVNRTYNITNRGLIQVTLGPFECILESCV